jgi:NAD(P)H-dependent FMN reductase
MPGVAKNGIDWLSRPPSDIKRVFGGKPVAIMSASPGGFGAVLSQTAWLPVMKTLGASVWSGPRLTVSRAGSVFAEDGSLTDDTIREQLRKFLAGFVASLQGVSLRRDDETEWRDTGHRHHRSCRPSATGWRRTCA